MPLPQIQAFREKSVWLLQIPCLSLDTKSWLIALLLQICTLINQLGRNSFQIRNREAMTGCSIGPSLCPREGTKMNQIIFLLTSICWKVQRLFLQVQMLFLQCIVVKALCCYPLPGEPSTAALSSSLLCPALASAAHILRLFCPLKVPLPRVAYSWYCLAQEIRGAWNPLTGLLLLNSIILSPFWSKESKNNLGQRGEAFLIFIGFRSRVFWVLIPTSPRSSFVFCAFSQGI